MVRKVTGFGVPLNLYHKEDARMRTLTTAGIVRVVLGTIPPDDQGISYTTQKVSARR